MTALLLLAGTLALQPPPAQPLPAGTAVIRGQVTDKETGAPMPRALVTMRLLAQGNRVSQSIADHDGRFEFVNLATGRYEVSATAGEHRGGYLRASYQERPVPAGVTPTLTLKDGEIRTDITIALPRALAVSGRVVDEFGDPLAGVNTSLIPLGAESRGSFQRGGTTDDLGMFRLYGVMPGRYLVCTQVEFTDMLSRGEGAAPSERFASTCYPSALQQSDGQPVVVGTSDVDGIEIRMRKSRAFSISGTVVDSTGAPVANPSVTLVHFRGDGAASTGSSAPGGAFLFRGLLPGEYAVEASSGADRVRQDERGFVSLQVANEDITNVVVTLQKAASVSGRILFEDTAPSLPPGNAITISPQPVRRAMYIPSRPATVDADHAFTLTDLFGPNRLNVQGLPRGWAVKSIRYRGQDITGTAAEFATDTNQQVEITLTSRLAVVSGTVMDDSAKPAAGALVMMLPADPKRWTAEFLYQYPRTGVSRDGRFALPGVVAGDYLLVAIAADQSRVLSPDKLGPHIISKYAERVSLVENDRLTMNLRVVTLPEPR
jgi:hypothetical protein